VAGRRVAADSHHFCTHFMQLRQGGSEVHRLPGAAVGIVLGIKVENQPFAQIALQANLLNLLIARTGQAKLRCRISNFNHN
jgi:hypothetical protein